jgi:hypothetical protein
MIFKNIELYIVVIENGILNAKELNVLDVLKPSPYTKRKSDLIRFQSVRLITRGIFNIMSEDIGKIYFDSMGGTYLSYLICYKKDIDSATLLLRKETIKHLQSQIDLIKSVDINQF